MSEVGKRRGKGGRRERGEKSEECVRNRNERSAKKDGGREEGKEERRVRNL